MSAARASSNAPTSESAVASACMQMGECRAVLDQDDAAENHAMRLVRKGQWKTSKRPTRGGGDEFVKACLSFSGFGREIQRCEAGYKMRDLPPWFSQWFLTANLNARDAVNFTAGETADDLELPATAAGAWAPLAAAGRAAPRVPAWGAPDQAAVSFHRVKPSVRAQGPLSRDPRCVHARTRGPAALCRASARVRRRAPQLRPLPSAPPRRRVPQLQPHPAFRPTAAAIGRASATPPSSQLDAYPLLNRLRQTPHDPNPGVPLGIVSPHARLTKSSAASTKTASKMSPPTFPDSSARCTQKQSEAIISPPLSP